MTYNRNFGASCDYFFEYGYDLYGYETRGLKPESEVQQEKLEEWNAELEATNAKLGEQRKTVKSLFEKMRAEYQEMPYGGEQPYPEYATVYGYAEDETEERALDVKVCSKTGCIEKRTLRTLSDATALYYNDAQGDMHLIACDDNGYFAPPPTGWNGEAKVFFYNLFDDDDDDEEEEEEEEEDY